MGIELITFEIQLHDDTKYRIECGRKEIDKLIELIGEHNIFVVDEI